MPHKAVDVDAEHAVYIAASSQGIMFLPESGDVTVGIFIVKSAGKVQYCEGFFFRNFEACIA